MNSRAFYLGVFFVVAPILMVSYKVFVLDTPFLPVKTPDTWNYEIQIKRSAVKRLQNSLGEELYLPIPPNTDYQTVRSFKISPSPDLAMETRVKNPYLVVRKEDILNKGDLKASAIITRSHARKMEKESLNRSDRKKYLDLTWVDEEGFEGLTKLNDSLIDLRDSDREKVDKIIYFITDEFVMTPGESSFSEVTRLFSGNSLDQARLFTALLRLNKIPSRISFGTYITDASDEKKKTHRRTFLNEVYIGKAWRQFHSDFKELDSPPENFLLIQRDIDQNLTVFSSRDVYNIRVRPKQSVFYDSKEAMENIVNQSSFLPVISLYTLPLPLQKVFFTLLLIPIGTFVLCFFRNIVGITTFGVFTPILLSLFFLETSLFVGFVMATIVGLSGVALHYFFNKLYLLAVPRLSIVLTFVVIIYVVVALISEQLGLVEMAASVISAFPIVIITIFTERFVIKLQEEGVRITAKAFLGTVVVAVCSFLIFSIEALGLAVFNHPELLLITIGLNMFIGIYSGFRLTEFFRFKELYANR